MLDAIRGSIARETYRVWFWVGKEHGTIVEYVRWTGWYSQRIAYLNCVWVGWVFCETQVISNKNGKKRRLAWGEEVEE